MEVDGLIDARVVHQERRPNKRLFTVTEAALRDRLRVRLLGGRSLEQSTIDWCERTLAILADGAPAVP